MSHYFILLLFNSINLFCFTLKDNTFLVSTSKAHFNLIKLIFVAALFVIVMNIAPIEVFGEETVALNNTSQFSQVIVLLLVNIEQATALVMSLQNFYKRTAICDFMNKILEVGISAESQRSLKLVSYKIIGFVSIILAVVFSAVLSAGSSMLSVVVLFFMMFPYYVLMAFKAFMKFFEAFFLHLLKDFGNQLRSFQKGCREKDESYRTLLIKYDEIYNLSKDFNDIFGAQMSTTTACDVTLLILQVHPPKI